MSGESRPAEEDNRVTRVSNNARRMMVDRDRVQRALKHIPDDVIVELARRASSRVVAMVIQRGDGRSAKGTHSDPTAQAAIASLSGFDADDPVYEAVRTVARALDDMAALSVVVENGVRFITDVQERVKEAEITYCGACRREVMNTPNDRLRSGYCAKCYMRWLRAKRPYRAQFELLVRNDEENENMSRNGTHVSQIGTTVSNAGL
jgi:hypothetical protein